MSINNLLKERKALMTMGMIITIVITLISFVLISGTIYRFMTNVGEKELSGVICHDSVALRATTAVNLLDKEIKWSPLACKTIDQEISGDKEKIKRKFAEMSARTWWMFGEGKYDEISGGIKGILPEFRANNDCFLAYSVVVQETDDFQGNDLIDTKELVDFLMKNNFSKINVNYLDYIQDYSGPGRIIIFNEIKPGHAYGISFAAKNTEIKDVPSKIGAIIAGVGLIFVPGGQIGGGILISSGVVSLTSDIIEYFYTERDVSSIYIQDLKTAQKNCYNGDSAGK